MAKLAHVSYLKRHHEGRYSGGGVEKFAHFLKMAIPDLQVFSYQDLPGSISPAQEEWEKARQLNEWLLQEKLVDKDTVVVGDGFWVDGLQGKVARLISVIHGAYWGSLLEHEKNPWGEPWLGTAALEQERVWRDTSVEKVAVSKRSAFELFQTCVIQVNDIIDHGVPLDVYKPNRENRNGIIHVAVSERKGKSMIPQVSSKISHPIELLGYSKDGDMAEEAKLWNRGMMFFSPSTFEGSSYALIEALACGLPVVAYKTGYVYDLPCDVGLTTDDHSVQNYVMLINNLMSTPNCFFPREFAEDRLSFDLFAKRWNRYLEVA